MPLLEEHGRRHVKAVEELANMYGLQLQVAESYGELEQRVKKLEAAVAALLEGECENKRYS